MVQMTINPGTDNPELNAGVRVASRCRLVLCWPDGDPSALLGILTAPLSRVRRILLVCGPGDVEPTALDRRVRIVHVGTVADAGPALLPALSDTLPFLAEGLTEAIIGAARRRNQPDICRAVEDAFLRHVRYALGLVKLQALRGWHVQINTWMNLPLAVAHASGLHDLKGSCEGKTALVIGAGPSLDDSIPAIVEFGRRAVLIACDGAMQTLDRAGVVPDFIVSTDDSDKVWRLFAGLSPRQYSASLVGLLHSCHVVLRKWRGPIFLGKGNKALDVEIARIMPGIPSFDTGLCVGHAALEFARIIGVERIVLTGFDLSFPQGKPHPVHHAVPYYRDDPPRPEATARVTGFDGSARFADAALIEYRAEFERRIADMKTAVCNATVSGVEIKGAERADLGRLLASLPDAMVATERIGPLEMKAMCNDTDMREFTREWKGVFVNFARAIGKIRKESNWPAHTGSMPFPALCGHERALAVIENAENPALIAAFRLEWEDWLAAGSHGGKAAEKARTAAGMLLESFQFTSLLFANVLQLAEMTRFKPNQAKRALAISDAASTSPEWRIFLETWRGSGWEVSEWKGESGDIPGIWTKIAVDGIGMVLSSEGCALPPAWMITGCGCIDFRANWNPLPVFLREHWQPGYGVAVSNRKAFELARGYMPADIPVFCVESGARGIAAVEEAAGRVIVALQMLDNARR